MLLFFQEMGLNLSWNVNKLGLFETVCRCASETFFTVSISKFSCF
jgi:hypothetical protein